MKKKKKHPILRVRKSMPCPTGTKAHLNKKKEEDKNRCRQKIEGEINDGQN